MTNPGIPEKSSPPFALKLALLIALAVPAALTTPTNAAPAPAPDDEAHADQTHDLATQVQAGFMRFNDSLQAYLRCRQDPENKKPEKQAANCPFDPSLLRQAIPDLVPPRQSASPVAVTANIPWIRARLLASLSDTIRSWKTTLGSDLSKAEALQEILSAVGEIQQDLAYVKTSRAAGASTIKNAQQFAEQSQETNNDLVTEFEQGQKVLFALELLNSRIARGKSPEARDLKDLSARGAFPLFVPDGYCSEKVPEPYDDPSKEIEQYQAQGKPAALLKAIEVARRSSEVQKQPSNLELSLTVLESMVDLYQRHWSEFRFEEQKLLDDVQHQISLAEAQRARLADFCTHLVRAVTDSRNKAISNPQIKSLLAKPSQPAVQGAQ